MTAYYPPMPDETFNGEGGFTPPLSIRHDHIVIGDLTIDGKWIEQDGISIHPGSKDDVNRVTVTFLVGPVAVEDAAIPHVKVDADV